MGNSKVNLIIGIVLVLIVAAEEGITLSHGQTPTARALGIDACLLVFATSRFLMYKTPDSPLIRPLRMLALFGVLIAWFVIKS